jgi:hypothetical protein
MNLVSAILCVCFAILTRETYCILFFPIRSPSNAHDNAASNLLSGGNLDSMINQRMEMGGGSWDRDKVQGALRAAYNNPERAVEYLYSVCICFSLLYFLNWIHFLSLIEEIRLSNNRVFQ